MENTKIDLYSTHIEYLNEIFKVKNNIETTVEYGTGNYSTGLLIDNSELCISIEMQSEDWYNKIVDKFSDKKNWIHYLKLGPMEWTNLQFPNKIDLGFVDGHGGSRPECINFLMSKNCPIIVSHDTEEPGYGWNRVNENNQYKKIIFTKYKNWTTLWTTDDEVYQHFSQNNIL